jgi:hypothetical protein
LVCWLLLVRPCAAQATSHEVRLRSLSPLPSRVAGQLLTRLNAELKVAGFSVNAGDTPDAPGDYADIVVTARGERVQVEITTTAEGASSHVVLNGGEREIAALALQATEFLRAGLSPRVTLPPASIPAAPAVVSERALPRTPPRGGFGWGDVGASVLSSWHAHDRLALLSLAGGYAWPQGVSAGLGLDLPLNSATFRTAHGSADYRVLLTGMDLGYAPLSWSGGAITLGLYAGAARVSSVGHPDAPSLGRSPQLWALALGARLGFWQQLGGVVAVHASARVLGLSPSPVVAVLSDERRLGNPSAVLELGLRVLGR